MNQPPPPKNMPVNTIVPFSTTSFYPDKPIQVTFLSLELLSLTLTFTLAMTIAFARSIKRHPFIITYLLLSGFYSASTVISLIPAGGYITQIPVLPLAIVQAGVSFAGGTVAAYSDMLLASLMFFKIMPAQSQLAKFGDSRGYSLFLLISPWFLFFAISIVGMCIGGWRLNIEHQGLLCFLAIPGLLDLYYITTMVFFACTTIIDLVMASCLFRYHHQRPFSTSSPGHPCSVNFASSTQDVSAIPYDSSFSSNSLPDIYKKGPHDRKASMATISMQPHKKMNKNLGLAVRVIALGTFFFVNMILHILIVAGKLPAGPVLLYSANRGTIIFVILASQLDIYTFYLDSFNTFLVDLRDTFYLFVDILARPFRTLRKRSSSKHSITNKNIRSDTPGFDTLSRTDSKGSSLKSSNATIAMPVVSFHQKRAFEEFDMEEKGPANLDVEEMFEEKARFGSPPTNSGVMVSVEVEVFSEDSSSSLGSSTSSSTYRL